MEPLYAVTPPPSLAAGLARRCGAAAPNALARGRSTAPHAASHDSTPGIYSAASDHVSVVLIRVAFAFRFRPSDSPGESRS